MSKAKYFDKEVSAWNVNDYHAYLIDLTTAKFGVEYVPFGKGEVSRRWNTEKGMLKNTQGRLGNEVLYRWITYCVDNYQPNARYPFINFGFMNAYRRDDIARVQALMAAEKRREEELLRQQQRNAELGDDWF